MAAGLWWGLHAGVGEAEGRVVKAWHTGTGGVLDQQRFLHTMPATSTRR